MQEINKYLIIIVLILIASLTAVSFGYFKVEVKNENTNPINVTTGSLDLNISDVKIYSDNIIPIYDDSYLSSAYKKEFVISNTEKSINSCTNIYLNIESISESLKSEYFKYKIISSDKVESSGSFSKIDNNRISLLNNEYLKPGEFNVYTLYLWISYQDDIDQMSMLNSSITASILVEGFDRECFGGNNG